MAGPGRRRRPKAAGRKSAKGAVQAPVERLLNPRWPAISNRAVVAGDRAGDRFSGWSCQVAPRSALHKGCPRRSRSRSWPGRTARRSGGLPPDRSGRWRRSRRKAEPGAAAIRARHRRGRRAELAKAPLQRTRRVLQGRPRRAPCRAERRAQDSAPGRPRRGWCEDAAVGDGPGRAPARPDREPAPQAARQVLAVRQVAPRSADSVQVAAAGSMLVTIQRPSDSRVRS